MGELGDRHHVQGQHQDRHFANVSSEAPREEEIFRLSGPTTALYGECAPPVSEVKVCSKLFFQIPAFSSIFGPLHHALLAPNPAYEPFVNLNFSLQGSNSQLTNVLIQEGCRTTIVSLPSHYTAFRPRATCASYVTILSRMVPV